jgi:hypothetical protein
VRLRWRGRWRSGGRQRRDRQMKKGALFRISVNAPVVATRIGAQGVFGRSGHLNMSLTSYMMILAMLG